MIDLKIALDGTLALRRAIHLWDPDFSCDSAARSKPPESATDVMRVLLNKGSATTDSFQLQVQAARERSCCDESTEAKAVYVGSFGPRV
jgi:hypothetical protein